MRGPREAFLYRSKRLCPSLAKGNKPAGGEELQELRSWNVAKERFQEKEDLGSERGTKGERMGPYTQTAGREG